MWLRASIGILATLAVAATGAVAGPILWAWERPEDLRFVGSAAEVAVETGFIVLRGTGIYARGRRFPLRMAGRPSTVMVHIQIDHHQALAWTAEQRRDTVQAVLAFVRPGGARRAQIDFEVRQSERRVLLDVLTDVHQSLPAGEILSMTALASWCDTETWLDEAPVDEIVPMLFRMGPDGQALKTRLKAGGDFANPRCRSALAISVDAPLTRAPTGRRVYLFDPRGWTQADFQAVQRGIERW